MSIFDTIKEAVMPTPAPQQPAPVAAPGGQGNIPPQQQVVAEPNNPTAPVQVAPVEPVVPAEPETPLAQFEKLWEAVPVDPNATPDTPAPQLTAEAISKIVETADFSKTITPESLAAITAGGEGAAEAFTAAMNAVARQTMVQSTLVNSKLTEKAVIDALAKQEAALPALLRSQSASAHLIDTNPLFDNPAVKPIMEATRDQLLVKHPTATPAQITKMTEDYILAVSETFAPKAPVSTTAEGDTDWSEFLNAPNN
jgi:hypothetical protein